MFNTLAKHKGSQQTVTCNYYNALSFLTLTMIVIFLSLSFLSKNVQAETTISAARVSSGTEFTRFTLESNSPIQYSLIMLDNPGRVVVDIENAVSTPALESLAHKIKTNDALVQAVRIGQFTPYILRLVFDLKATVVPQAFVLDPMESFGHRLVLDIYPADQAAKLKPVPDSDPMKKFIAAMQKPDRPQYGPRNSEHYKLLNFAQATKPITPRIIIVAIDAGHGGKDPGAIGHKGTYEKDITLAIARKLKTRIDQEPNMKGVLIRDGDHSMSLEMRRVKARRLNADLFVSVHADAAKRTGAHGSSVYTLSQHGATSTAASWLAKKENSVDSRLVNGLDVISKSAEIKEVLMDLTLSATINDSVKLAQHVLDELGGINHLHKEEVEQAGFVVLKSHDIPSILVETAFLSNPGDEKKLTTKAYQNEMAQAMFTGIKRYFVAGAALARTNMAQSE